MRLGPASLRYLARRAGLERDRRDRDIGGTAAIAGELLEIGRRRVACCDDPVDAQRECAVADAARKARSIERDDVAVLQLPRARQRLAADAQIARAAAGLNEERVLEAADLDAAGYAFERDVGIVCRTEGHG